MKRTLSLKRERLVELTHGELASVYGGRIPPTLPAKDCLTLDGCLSLSCPQATCNCCTGSASC